MSHRHRHGPSGPSPFVLEEARHVVRREEEERMEEIIFKLMGFYFLVGVVTNLVELLVAVYYGAGGTACERKGNIVKRVILMLVNAMIAWYWMRRGRQH